MKKGSQISRFILRVCKISYRDQNLFDKFIKLVGKGPFKFKAQRR